MQKRLGRPGDPYCSMGDYPTPGLILQNPSEKGTFLILQRLCVKWCTKQTVSINPQDCGFLSTTERRKK